MFRTEIELTPFNEKINHYEGVFFIGSCFSDNIGGKLTDFKFNAKINPFGVVYNPVSVKNSLEIIVTKELFQENDLGFYKGLYYSFYHHSFFSDSSKEKCLHRINNEIEHAHKKLKAAKFLFITFGTSKVYESKTTGNVVSNCHKIPASEFSRRNLSPRSIVEDYIPLVELLKDFNPELKIWFTVSPIRHWKDGAVENQFSKSVLLVAVHELCDLFGHCHYFPAYELMNDDLRDYRFYAEDMIHLNASAIHYIWTKFESVFLTRETLSLNAKIKKIKQAAMHRPFRIEDQEYQLFVEKQLGSIQDLLDVMPGLDFSEEISLFKSRLI